MLRSISFWIEFEEDCTFEWRNFARICFVGEAPNLSGWVVVKSIAVRIASEGACVILYFCFFSNPKLAGSS